MTGNAWVRLLLAGLLSSISSIGVSHGSIVVSSFTPYSQNFNFLSNSRAFNFWTDDAATETAGGSPGWLWQNVLTPGTQLFYEAGGATSSVGVPYALMESGNPATLDDQAMGSLNGSDNPYTAWGVVFRNNTGQSIVGVEVSYTGEQWRRATAADALQFSFRVSPTAITDLAPSALTPAGWTPYPTLNFNAPVVLPGQPRFVLDGNAAANRQSISGTLPITVANGETFALRWRDADAVLDTGAALGIDDLTVRFLVASVPEASGILPWSAVAALSAGVSLARRWGCTTRRRSC